MTTFKKHLAALLSALMVILPLPGNVFAADISNFTDFSSDWSTPALKWAVENDLLSGYDGKINGSANISRAEMAAIINRAFGAFNEDALSDYKDVSEENWYFSDMAKAVRMGVFYGSDGNLLPNEPITREQTFAVLARAFALDCTDESVLSDFSDSGLISDWARPYTAAMISNGYVQGSNGKINPNEPITRAEFAQLFYNIAGCFVDEVFENQVINGNAIVRDSGTKLSNLTINRDLILADGIDLTGIELTDVNITGRLLLRAGGKSVILKNVTVSGDVVVNSAYDAVHIVSENSNLSTVVANSDVIIDSDTDEIKVLKASDDVSVVTRTSAQKTLSGLSVSNSSKSVSSSSGGSSSGKKSSSGGSSGGSSGSKSDADTQSNSIVEKAVLCDLGWSQFVVAWFSEGNSLNNCTLTIDGTDVTSAFTPVTDDGSIVKWEITNLNPAKLAAKCKDKTQEIVLSNNSAPVAPTLKTNTSPGYMIAHGPLALWDYYLTVYDTDGAVRVEPSKTTFDIKGSSSVNAPASYSPVAEISEKGTGTVEIMFNYNQDWEKEWVDAIQNKSGSVQLVAYDENQNTLNSNLAFELNKNVPHGKGNVGQILIKLGQDNFRTNGRYYVRVRSENHDTVLVPIHIVNEKAPTMQVTSESDIRSGENVTFIIKDMTYSITNPTFEAELTRPDGTTITLEMITDWYQIGPYLYLYNTEDADGIDRNKIPYAGEYTLTVHSNGFKDMSAKFYVSEGKETTLKSGSKMSLMSVDAVSSATSCITVGADGSTSTSYVVSADVKFNADLLINAKIISEHLGIDNQVASDINDRWRQMTPDSVSAANTKLGGFDWNEYYAAVSTARSNGKYLSFADFAKENSDLEKLTRPYAVKSVLENNLLGDIQSNGSWIGIETPKLALVKQNENGDWIPTGKVMQGEDIHLICYDKDYFSSVTSVNLNGNSADLVKDIDYEMFISTDNSLMLLTIHPHTQNLILNYTNNIVIEADGYQDNRLRISYEPYIEDNIYLSSDKEIYTRDSNGTEPVTVTVQNSDGDYIKHFYEVEVTSENGNVKRVLSASVGGTATYYYTITDDNKICITDSKGTLFPENGKYTLTLKASEYYNAISVSIKVSGALKTVPNINPSASAVKDEYYSDIMHYYLDFGADNKGSGLGAWKNAISSVTVNGFEYTEAGFFQSVSRSNYSWPSQSGNNIVMELYSKPGFKDTENNTVVIKAVGYDDLTYNFVITESAEEQETKIPPAFNSAEKVEMVSEGYADYYRIKFQGDNADIDAYLKAITSVSVDSVNYSLNNQDLYYLSSYAKYKYMRSGILNNYAYLDLTADGIEDFGKATTITITAFGYDDLEFVIDNTENKPKQVPVAFCERVEASTPYYRISFDTDAREYIAKITDITVDGKAYKKTNYLNGKSQYMFNCEWPYSYYKYVDISDDGTGDSPEIIINAKGYESNIVLTNK